MQIRVQVVYIIVNKIELSLYQFELKGMTSFFTAHFGIYGLLNGTNVNNSCCDVVVIEIVREEMKTFVVNEHDLMWGLGLFCLHEEFYVLV